ncbi:MAG: hypothetical protein ACM4D3_13340 [Candidatus Sericytochromatia bacterium]
MSWAFDQALAACVRSMPRWLSPTLSDTDTLSRAQRLVSAECRQRWRCRLPAGESDRAAELWTSPTAAPSTPTSTP